MGQEAMGVQGNRPLRRNQMGWRIAPHPLDNREGFFGGRRVRHYSTLLWKVVTDAPTLQVGEVRHTEAQ